MARVDKTESAVGVTRGTLLADIPQALWGVALGVGVNAAGLTVRGAGQSGIVGIIIADKTNYKAGTRCDIIGNGSELVEFPGVPGTVYYAAVADGVISTTNTGTRLGYTIEADRLVVTL